jgi:protein-tyrosine phosphatase
MKTEVLKLDGSSMDLAKIRHAAKLLQAGALVAFPTETVYGLGADARNPEALQRLNEVKKRPEGKPYSLLVPSQRHAEEATGGLSRVAQKLTRLYWPGPLTVIVPRRGGGVVGLRLPEHPVARSLLAQCGFPLATPSANKSGQPDALTAEGALKTLGGKIPLILDGGPARQGKASVVVRLDPRKPPEIQREGMISEKEILRVARPCILFVCTGNTCRSPMAEALCRHYLEEQGMGRESVLPFWVRSSGTSAVADMPADPQAVAVLKKLKLDLQHHSSKPLTPEMIDTADWIFTMTWAQRESILRLMPTCRDRLRLLSSQGEDIPDPASRSMDRYRQVRDMISTCLRDVMKTIAGSEV